MQKALKRRCNAIDTVAILIIGIHKINVLYNLIEYVRINVSGIKNETKSKTDYFFC